MASCPNLQSPEGIATTSYSFEGGRISNCYLVSAEHGTVNRVCIRTGQQESLLTCYWLAIGLPLTVVRVAQVKYCRV